MARIAFDVQGTLRGYNSVKIIAFFRFLQTRGHECSIWSFGGAGMARDAAKFCGLQPKMVMSKDDKSDDPFFDACVDDEPSTARGLDAKQVIDVRDVPESEDDFENFALKFFL